MFLHLLLEFR